MYIVGFLTTGLFSLTYFCRVLYCLYVYFFSYGFYYCHDQKVGIVKYACTVGLIVEQELS